MKKAFVLRFVFAVLAAAALLALASCSDASGSSGSGAVSLVLDQAFFKKAAQAGIQKSGENDFHNEKITMRVEISLNGEYSAAST